MFSHGVGALVDLPNFSAVVAGLDDWDTTCQQTLVERRLLAAVRQMPNMEQVDALRTAPWLEETRNPFDDWARVGVTVVPFPRWMRCTGCNLLIPIDSGLLDLKHEPYRPDRTRFVHNCRSGGRPPLAVPARFVTACQDGHLDEFPWIEFCHYKQACSGKPQVRLPDQPLYRPVHKALHRPLTVWGVDRRLFFLALLMGTATFNLFYSFLAGLLVFGGLYLFARWATARDPDMLRILLSSSRIRRRYDPGKHEPFDLELVRC